MTMVVLSVPLVAHASWGIDDLYGLAVRACSRPPAQWIYHQAALKPAAAKKGAAKTPFSMTKSTWEAGKPVARVQLEPAGMETAAVGK